MNPSATIVESTYGDRERPPRRLYQFADAITTALGRGGSVLIPAFAVDRTEVVLMALREMIAAGQVPAVPVYVDSPMALAALAVYRNAMRAGGPEMRPLPADSGDDPFDPGTLRLARTVGESTALNHRTIRASSSRRPEWPPADASCTIWPASPPTRATSSCSLDSRYRARVAGPCSKAPPPSRHTAGTYRFALSPRRRHLFLPRRRRRDPRLAAHRTRRAQYLLRRPRRAARIGRARPPHRPPTPLVRRRTTAGRADQSLTPPAVNAYVTAEADQRWRSRL